MTKEEAIKIIDDECEHIKHHLTEKGKAEEFYIELGNMVIAFEMGIRALEQEPTKQREKELAEEWKCGYEMGFEEAKVLYEKEPQESKEETK